MLVNAPNPVRLRCEVWDPEGRDSACIWKCK